MTIDPNQLKKGELAKALRRCPNWVTGMIRAGYIMETGGTSSLNHALTWLADRSLEGNPFRLSDWYPELALSKKERAKRALRRMKLSRQPEAACKSNESH